MLNQAACERLAVWLEKGGDDDKPEGVAFDMGKYCGPNESKPSPCGTAACMSGIVNLWLGFHPELLSITGGSTIRARAAEHLGLTEEQSVDLFVPGYGTESHDQQWFGAHHDMAEVDAAWAGRVVRDLMKTGEVNWYRNQKGAEA